MLGRSPQHILAASAAEAHHDVLGTTGDRGDIRQLSAGKTLSIHPVRNNVKVNVFRVDMVWSRHHRFPTRCSSRAATWARAFSVNAGMWLGGNRPS
ncbi:Uncharacterised protein [Mycobacteroides abscessus subsp. abscessus]|nr:Uncharacterised protein [Mycobacteroides abscessus subsp. abscessus]